MLIGLGKSEFSFLLDPVNPARFRGGKQKIQIRVCCTVLSLMASCSMDWGDANAMAEVKRII